MVDRHLATGGHETPEAKTQFFVKYLPALLLVFVGAAIYAPRLAAIGDISHDDGISLLAATCNQGAFRASIPTDQWVKASEWQQYWQLKSFGCFGQISHDLAKTDIHPPLYFWLLHIWFFAFGVSASSGLMLNLLFLLITAATIFFTCRTLNVSASISFLTSLAWMVSLPSRVTVEAIRQYTLLTMLAVLLVFSAIKFLKSGRKRDLAPIAVISTAGFLTSFLFVVPAMFVMLFSSAILIKCRRPKDMRTLLSLFAFSAAAFVAAFPEFASAIRNGREQFPELTLSSLVPRLEAIGTRPLEIFRPLDARVSLSRGLSAGPVFDRSVEFANLLVAIGVLILLVAAALKSFRSRPIKREDLLTAGMLPTLVALTSWLAVVGQYALHLAPAHAGAFYYIHFAIAILFISFAQLLQRSGLISPSLLKFLLSAAIAIGILTTFASMSQSKKDRRQLDQVTAAQAIIMDTRGRGRVVPILMHAESSAKVFVARNQAQLIDTMSAIASVEVDDLAYISYARGSGNSKEKQGEIVALLSEGAFSRKPSLDLPWPWASIFNFNRR